MAHRDRRSSILLTLLLTLALTATASASPLNPKARGLWAWLASTWSWVAAWAKAEAPSGLTEGMPGDRGDAGVNIDPDG